MKNIIILLGTILLFAVTGFSQIEGRVVDAKGAGVPKVIVTATGEDGTVAATVTTDEDGNYVFEELSPGKYKITAKGPAAFQPAVRENVNVAEDETTTLNITLAAEVQPPVKPVAPQKQDTQPGEPPKCDGKKVYGRVKFFNDAKGYGFIRPNSGGPDVFFSIMELRRERTGMEIVEPLLAEITLVKYLLKKDVGKGKLVAECVDIAHADDPQL